MRNPSALPIAAALAVIAAFPPAQAQERRPAIPAEQGVRPVGRVGWLPYRCSDGPVYNFYHDALYHGPPAVYLGFAYRPYYRYTAWHVVPRTFVCAER
jgi:hypothetical protein